MDHLEYLREIGKRGGKRRAERVDRSELARQAAKIRWAKHGSKIRPISKPGPKSSQALSQNEAT